MCYFHLKQLLESSLKYSPSPRFDDSKIFLISRSHRTRSLRNTTDWSELEFDRKKQWVVWRSNESNHLESVFFWWVPGLKDTAALRDWMNELLPLPFSWWGSRRFHGCWRYVILCQKTSPPPPPQLYQVYCCLIKISSKSSESLWHLHRPKGMIVLKYFGGYGWDRGKIKALRTNKVRSNREIKFEGDKGPRNALLSLRDYLHRPLLTESPWHLHRPLLSDFTREWKGAVCKINSFMDPSLTHNVLEWLSVNKSVRIIIHILSLNLHIYLLTKINWIGL